MLSGDRNSFVPVGLNALLTNSDVIKGSIVSGPDGFTWTFTLHLCPSELGQDGEQS